MSSKTPKLQFLGELPSGKDGEDGVSPTVSVEEITGGHRVTITDKDGTQSFDVMNGADGKGEKGDTPVRGADYWTEEDKAEIINGVLNALPYAEGGSF